LRAAHLPFPSYQITVHRVPSRVPFTVASSSTYLHHFLPPDHHRLNVEQEANTSHPRRLPLWLIYPEPVPKHVQIHYWIKSTVKEADTVDIVKRIDDKETERLAYIWQGTERKYKSEVEYARTDALQKKRAVKKWRWVRWQGRIWRAKEMLGRTAWWRKREEPRDIPSV
jgi:hypothetical protein